MASLQERKRGKRTYYYLEHSLRVRDTVQKKKMYLGTSLPKDIDGLKKKFRHDIFREKWFTELDNIKKAYLKERRITPLSAKQKEMHTFAVKFTYDTQRIEGSTLSLRETAELLEKGMSPQKPIQDVLEAQAHRKVFYLMLESMKEMSYSNVLHWHKVLLQETKPEMAGKTRRHQVAIAGSKFMPPSPIEVDILLGEFFDKYKQEKNTVHPVELAALVHLRFVTIHPFGDGNGRISRLMMNFVLHRYDFPLLNIPYTDRNSYYTALERAQIQKEESIFVRWFIKHYIKEQKKVYRF